MLNREHPAPFVIVGETPGGALAIPTTSARTATQAARHLTEHCPHTQATWQANPHAGPGPVAVFGCARPPAGEHLPHQDTHAFLLAPGEALPPVWVALCGHQIEGAEFEPSIRAWADPAQAATTGGPAPTSSTPACPSGRHLHPQLRCAPLVLTIVPDNDIGVAARH